MSRRKETEDSIQYLSELQDKKSDTVIASMLIEIALSLAVIADKLSEE